MQLEATGFFSQRIARAAEAWAGHNWTSRMLYVWSFHRTAEVGILVRVRGRGSGRVRVSNPNPNPNPIPNPSPNPNPDQVGFLFAGAVTFVAYATREQRSAEEGALIMTYAYVAPFFVSAAFQMVTQARHRVRGMAWGAMAWGGWHRMGWHGEGWG